MKLTTRQPLRRPGAYWQPLVIS